MSSSLILDMPSDPIAGLKNCETPSTTTSVGHGTQAFPPAPAGLSLPVPMMACRTTSTNSEAPTAPRHSDYLGRDGQPAERLPPSAACSVM
mmetsp:Transcript_72625/g.166588  ORF Transcript_72625/g.166588 Transcript_72625/m.166588 type:complete len:91 (+) Transcript_72625:49-321(+)